MRKSTFKKTSLSFIILIFLLLIIVLSNPIAIKNEQSGIVYFGTNGWISILSEDEFKIYLNEFPPTSFAGIDGPYVINDTIYRVNVDNQLLKKPFNPALDTLLTISVGNADQDTFHVEVASGPFSTPASHWESPDSLIAISDIEGNFNAFSSLLKSNGVTDSNFNWSFGKGHLVLAGDFVDRGEEVTAVLWLIYKLDQQAKKAGGYVHFLLGNHEIMNLQGRAGYVKEKYIKAAQEISATKNQAEALRFMYSEQSILGSWIRSKNIIEKIGENIFVHAGVSPALVEVKLNSSDINRIFHDYLANDLEKEESNDTLNLILGTEGPLWYRGLVKETSYNEMVSPEEFQKILSAFNAKKLIIGHTISDDIAMTFNNQVIMIDVLHGANKYSGLSKGLLVINSNMYKVDDLGKVTTLY